MRAAALFLGTLILCLQGCRAPRRAGAPATEVPPPPPNHGPKRPVCVLPLGLSEETAGQYPHLRERAVGFGVHNMLVEALYETKGFTLVEGRPEVLKEILERQWADASGMMSRETAIERGKLTGAKYILYGEVYDFGVSKHGLTVAFGRRRTETVHVGIQIRMVDVETGEFIPASGMGRSGVTTERIVFITEMQRFAATDIGAASRIAIRQAVSTLMARLSE